MSTPPRTRQFLDASELTRTVKKPASRTTSTSVNYQSIVDGVMEALERDRGRMAEDNTAQASNSSARSKKIAPRQGRRRRATHLQGALPAVHHPPAGLSDFRIRRMPDQVTRPMARLPVAVGRVVSLHRATAMAPGHGVTVASQSKLLYGHSLWDPAGCSARVARDSRHHSQEGHGHTGKKVHVSVPQPRAIQVIGDQDGAPRQVIAVDNSQPSSTPPDNDAGVRAPLISSPQRPSTRHLVAVDVMFVDSRVATPTSMDQERCLPRHHRPWDALSVDSEVAIPPAMRRTLNHRLLMLQASQRDRLQHLPWVPPARSQTCSGARTRASGPRSPMFLHALSQIKSGLCLR